MAVQRNEKGTGHTTAYGDGKLRLRLTIGGVTKSKIVNSEREAQKQVFLWHQEAEQGTLVSGNKITLKQTIQLWIDDSDHLALTTRQSYQQKLDAYVKYAPIGDIKLSSLRSVDIENFLKTLANGKFAAAKTKVLKPQINALEKKIKNGSDKVNKLRRVQLIAQLPESDNFRYSRSLQRQCFALIREGLKWAAKADRKLVSRNVALDVVPPAAMTNAKRDAALPGSKGEKFGYKLSHNDLMAILAVAEKHRLRLRWLLALDLGLRVGEVLGLCWEDFDDETGVLTIKRQVQHDVEAGQPCIVPRVKTPSGQREVPLPEYMVAEWNRWKRRQEREKGAPGWKQYRYGGHDYDLVFTQEGGGVISQRLDATWWKKLLQSTEVRDSKTGLVLVPAVEHVRRYVARHNAASRMVAMPNSDILSIAALLGHSSADFTLRKYSHALDEKKRKTIEDLNMTNTGRVERWKDSLDDELMGRTGEHVPDELKEERRVRAEWDKEDIAEQRAARDKRLEEHLRSKVADRATEGDSDKVIA